MIHTGAWDPSEEPLGADYIEGQFSGTITASQVGYRVLGSGTTPCGLVANWQNKTLQVGWNVGVTLAIPFGPVSFGGGYRLSNVTSIIYSLAIPPGGQQENRMWRWEVRQAQEHIAISGQLITLWKENGALKHMTDVQVNYAGMVYLEGPKVKLDVKCCGY